MTALVVQPVMDKESSRQALWNSLNRIPFGPYFELAKEHLKALTDDEKVYIHEYLHFTPEQLMNLQLHQAPDYLFMLRYYMDNTIVKDFNIGARWFKWDERLRIGELLANATPLGLNSAKDMKLLKDLAKLKTPLIYLFYCPRTGSIYIGQTINLFLRILQRLNPKTWNLRLDRVEFSYMVELSNSPWAVNGLCDWVNPGKHHPLYEEYLAKREYAKNSGRYYILDILSVTSTLDMIREVEARWINEYCPGLQGTPTSENLAASQKVLTRDQLLQIQVHKYRQNAIINSDLYNKFGLNRDALGNVLYTGPTHKIADPIVGIKGVAVHVKKGHFESPDNPNYNALTPEMEVFPSLNAAARKLKNAVGSGLTISKAADWFRKNSGVVIWNPVDGSYMIYHVLDNVIAEASLIMLTNRIRVTPLMEINPTRFTYFDFNQVSVLNRFFELTGQDKVTLSRSVVDFDFVIEIKNHSEPAMNGLYRIQRAINAR